MVARSAPCLPLGAPVQATPPPAPITVATALAHGTLSLGPDGSCLYTPNAGFTGQDPFTYHASDGAVAADFATVTITVTPGQPPRSSPGAGVLYAGPTRDGARGPACWPMTWATMVTDRPRRFCHELPHRDIAAPLDLTPETVRKRIQQARVLLQEQLRV